MADRLWPWESEVSKFESDIVLDQDILAAGAPPVTSHVA